MLIQASALAELADQLHNAGDRLIDHWDRADQCFRSWVVQPNLRSALRNYVLDLRPEDLAVVRGRSRETTTHFAWCLRDQPHEEFTFWLHEYKPQRDWRQGYADSVHNHRYHFCTTVVRGGYVHERYIAVVDPLAALISAVELVESCPWSVGSVGTLLSHEFHRIPQAYDDTLTFLIKSREVTPWSLSYDPNTRTSHQHVPVESRLADLPDRI